MKPPVSDELSRVVAEEEAKNTRRRQYVASLFSTIYASHVNICSPLNGDQLSVPNHCSDLYPYSLIRIDTLDALWTFGMKNEFWDSRRWVENRFDPALNLDVPVSEVSTRIIGGLLSAFDLSNRPIFLTRAVQLAKRLLPAFKSTFPDSHINLLSGNTKITSKTNNTVIQLGEIGTTQVEFAFIAHHTNEPKYSATTLDITRHIRKHPVEEGISGFATEWKRDKSGLPLNRLFSLTAGGSSRFYENTYKLHRLFYKRAKWISEMWHETAKSILQRLAVQSGEVVLIKEEDFGASVKDLKSKDELARTGIRMSIEICGLAGVFGLHAQDIQDSAEESAKFLSLAEGLASVCVEAYRQNLATNFVLVQSGRVTAVPNSSLGYRNIDADYLIFESLMYLSRLTGNPKFRDNAWEIFEVVAQHFQLRVPNIKTQTGASTEFKQTGKEMRSFSTSEMRFLTKMLKFLFLTFSDSDVFPVAKTVWNGDGHAFATFKPDITLYT